MVRPERVELPTFWFVAKRSIQLSYGRTKHGSPFTKNLHLKNHAWLRWRLNNGAPGEIRTPDPLVRSQILYPAELRAHINNFFIVPNFPLLRNTQKLPANTSAA